jgi:hypothetical protein
MHYAFRSINVEAGDDPEEHLEELHSPQYSELPQKAYGSPIVYWEWNAKRRDSRPT